MISGGRAGERLLRGRRGGCFRCRAFQIGLLLFACFYGYAVGQELVTRDANKVKAAFLRNFAHYVTWPTSAFSSDDSPWSVGVLGDDPFGDTLERTLSDRTEQGRRFTIYRADSLDRLPPCHILFIAFDSAAKREAALRALKDQPVLTVGEAPGFLEEGGIIRFQVGTHVEMSINLDQARSVSLTVQTPMLEVSREVLEGGSVRELR